MGNNFAPVAGIDVLEQLAETDHLGNYLLLLAHDIVEYPDRYRTLVSNARKRYSKVFIIVDNSTVELGASMPARYLCVAAQTVNAHCIVLPDIIGDAEGTVRASINGAQALTREGNLHGAYMVVPQGRNVPELYWCIQHLSAIPGVAYWGVPRAIANKLGSREVLKAILSYDYVGTIGPCIHMLGMSRNIFDDLWCATYPNVMGIDSANPLVMGLEHKQFPEEYEHCERPNNYLSLEDVPKLSVSNITAARNLLKELNDYRVWNKNPSKKGMLKNSGVFKYTPQ